MPKAKSHIEAIARGLLLHRSRVLLCRNAAGGYYYLPGGHVEFGESASAATEREFAEETGLSVRCGACRLVTEGAFEAAGKTHHEVNLVFHVELPGSLAGDSPPPPIESREPEISFEWVELASVIGLDVRPAAIHAWLVAGGLPDPAVPPCAWVSEFPAVGPEI